MRLCAARTGTLLNLVSLATDAGISHTTARHWLSTLESSELVFLLPPYYRNFGKRLVKTPKLYFADTGLAAWLLGIRDPQLLALHPLRGALFESWIVGEFRKFRLNRGWPAGQRATRFVTEPRPDPWLLHAADESDTREGVRCISWRRFADPCRLEA